MWEWRNGGCSQQADKDLSGDPIWGEQEEGVGEGQFAWHSWGTVSAGTHTEEVSPWHPSPRLWNRAVQDAKKAGKEKRDPVMHNRSM